ncbi:MAG: hypothetical protein Tsb002_38700 [Wenzhouxiangellaceae bacterium]
MNSFLPMASKIRSSGVPLILGLAVAGAAWACFTPDRAAVLNKQHPDDDLVAVSVHAHASNPLPYVLAGSSACIDGFADIFPCSNVDLLAHIPLSDIGNGSGSDSWGWVDPMDGTEYAIVGRSSGVAFLDLSDPTNVVYLGNLPRPASASSSTWSDIKVYQDNAFMVADFASQHGMLVFNLTQLRNVANPPATFTPHTVYSEFSSAHNIAINTDTGFAYIVGSNTCSGGLHMVDISTPSAPTFAGCFSSDGYTHDVQCVVYQGPDVEHQGKEICFASNEDTLTIVDVSDKQNPVQISRAQYGDTEYTHQGWLTEDHAYFLLDDELDERNVSSISTTRTVTLNLTDLDNPTMAGEFFADGAAIDHNQYVVGNFTYQANYRRGLRILQIDDPATGALREVGYFDTFPEGDGNSFSGAWNVYPFFPSGNVLISDMNRGFLLVRPTVAGVDQILADGFE